MPRTAPTQPRLKFMATDWSFRFYPTEKRPWSIAKKVSEVKAAGFHGMYSGANAELAAELQSQGLEMVGGVDVGSKKDAVTKLQVFVDLGVNHVNIQLANHDTPTDKAVKLAHKVMTVGKKLGLTPTIEVHRDTCTETPEKAAALAKTYRKRYKEPLRMNYDHSHPAIIKQLRPPEYWSRLNDNEETWQASELVHFRPFTGSHCQTPVTNGKGRLDRDFQIWLDNYLEPALATWLEGAQPGQTLYVVPELGPQGSGYALECFPDIWKDVIREKNEIQKVWRKLMHKRKKKNN